MASPIKPTLVNADMIPVELPDGEVAEKIASGEALPLRGTEIPALDENNKKVMISAEDAQEKFASGDYKYFAPAAQQEYIDQKEFGEGADRAMQAAAAGAARGITLGLSDLAIQKIGTSLGTLDKETLEKLRKYNPGLSLSAEIGGAVLPAILSGGATAPESAAALAARGVVSKGLSMAAKAAALGPNTLSAIGRTAAEKIAAKATLSSGVQAVALNGAARLAPEAIIGAGYGAGSALSEAVLGHPDSVAEHFISSVGPEALLGAGIGVAAYPFIKLGEAAFEKAGSAVSALKGKTTEEAIAAVDITAERRAAKAAAESAGGSPSQIKTEIEYGPPASATEPIELSLARLGTPEEKAKKIVASYTELEEGAKELTDEAVHYGIGVAPGQVAKSQDAKWVEGYLAAQHGTSVGQAKQEFWKTNFEKIGGLIKESFGGLSEKSRFAAGTDVVNNLEKAVWAEGEPIGKMFEEVKAITGRVPTQKKIINQAIEELESISGYGKQTSGKLNKMVRDAVADLRTASTADEINQIRIRIQQMGQGATTGDVWHAVGEVSGALNKAYEDSVIGVAKSKLANGKFEELLKMHKEAKAQYKPFIESWHEITGKLGKERTGGIEGIVEYMKSKPAEQVVKRLFDSNDVAFARFFKEKAPNEFKILRDNYLSELAFKHGGENLDPKKIVKTLFDRSRVSPEMFDLMFDKEAKRALKFTKDWIDSVPKGIHPETAPALLFDKTMGGDGFSPTAMLKGLAKEWSSSLGSDILNASVRPDKSPQYKFMFGMADMYKKNKDGVLDGIAGMFKATGKTISERYVPGSVMLIKKARESVDENRKEQKKNREVAKKSMSRVREFASNPDLVIDAVSSRTKNMAVVAPNVTNAIAQKMAVASAYLSQNLPKDPLAGSSFGRSKWEPSDHDLNKWMRTYTAVQAPMTVINDLKNGSATKEGVQALKAVYPTIYKEVIDQVMDIATDQSIDMTYRAKTQVALLFGVPTDYTHRPDFILKMQLSHKQFAESVANNKTSATVSVADNAKSDTERAMTRG